MAGRPTLKQVTPHAAIPRTAKEISPIEGDLLRRLRLHFFQIELIELRPAGKHKQSVETSTPFITVLSLWLTWLILMDL